MNDHKRRKRGRVVIFLGPPGSGKGTQAAQLSSALGIPAISTGELLRRECQSGSKLGQAVQAVIASGQLVSDDLMNQVVASRLRNCDCGKGCILDGYPRTSAQARFLDDLLARIRYPAPVVIDLRISADDVIARLSHRRQCPNCGRIFSVDAQTPEQEFFCDRDGSKLALRADDHPAAIRERLQIYDRNTHDLVRYYQMADYHEILAARPASEIAEDILHILQDVWKAPTGTGMIGAPLVSPA
jgi:adenylate kinase